MLKDSTQRRRGGERSVAVMSIGSPNHKCAATVGATQMLWDSGVIMTAAAGNGNEDACLLYPARNPRTITVGATDQEDRVYSLNNFGDCIDIFGPGVNVLGAWGGDEGDKWKKLSGSSMAAPLVAGTAAIILGADPSLSSADVREILLSSSSRNRILATNGNNVITDSVNRFLYAPWNRLFDKVDMNKLENKLEQKMMPDSSTRLNKFQLEDPHWNDSASFISLSLMLKPKTKPAMHHAVVRITSALASLGGLRPTSILVRRANGVRQSVDGQEPIFVSLVFYFPMLPTLITEYKQRLQRADESGKLSEVSEEQFSFAQGSLESALLINVTVPSPDKTENTTDGDRSESSSGSDINPALKITFIVLGSIVVLGVLAAIVGLLVVPRIMAIRERKAAVTMARNNTIVMGLGGRDEKNTDQV